MITEDHLLRDPEVFPIEMWEGGTSKWDLRESCSGVFYPYNEVLALGGFGLLVLH